MNEPVQILERFVKRMETARRDRILKETGNYILCYLCVVGKKYQRPLFYYFRRFTTFSPSIYLTMHSKTC